MNELLLVGQHAHLVIRVKAQLGMKQWFAHCVHALFELVDETLYLFANQLKQIGAKKGHG
jgi:hypothetical protein